MSTAALKNLVAPAATAGGAPAAGAVTQRNTAPATVADLLTDDRVKKQIALAVPKHMNPERLARVMLTEVRKNPELAKAEPGSFMAAFMQAAQLGLEPGGALGHCYLIPFYNSRKGVTEVQFILGYKGMLDLARRSGEIESIEVRVVHERDKFHVAFGLDSDLQHVPDFDSEDPGAIRFVYAVAKLRGGGRQFEVMPMRDILKVRNGSQGYKRAAAKNNTDTPWIQHFEEMAKKTVLRRMFKYLPVSIEAARAASNDDAIDMGLPTDAIVFDDGQTIEPAVDKDTGEITGAVDAAVAAGAGQAGATAAIGNDPSPTLQQAAGGAQEPEAVEQKLAPGMEDHADFLAGMGDAAAAAALNERQGRRR